MKVLKVTKTRTRPIVYFNLSLVIFTLGKKHFLRTVKERNNVIKI